MGSRSFYGGFVLIYTQIKSERLYALIIIRLLSQTHTGQGCGGGGRGEGEGAGKGTTERGRSREWRKWLEGSTGSSRDPEQPCGCNNMNRSKQCEVQYSVCMCVYPRCQQLHSDACCKSWCRKCAVSLLQ